MFGASPGNAEVFNAFLGAATVPLLYLVALRSFGRPAAKLAGVLLALMPGQILVAEGILAETLYAFVLVGFFALLVTLPDRRWAAALLGAAVGVAALTRGEGLLLLVVPIAVWWGSLPRRELACPRGGDRRRRSAGRRAMDDPQRRRARQLRGHLDELVTDVLGRPQPVRVRRRHLCPG